MISISISNVRVYYENWGRLYYVDLDAGGNFTGTPVLLAEGADVAIGTAHVQGRYDANGNPVVSWKNQAVTTGLRRARAGGVWQAQQSFSLANLTEWDAQRHQAFSASLKEDGTRFHGLKKKNAAFNLIVTL